MACMQYTIRRIPRAVDDAIRERARATGKSLNEAVVDTLAQGAGVQGIRNAGQHTPGITRRSSAMEDKSASDRVTAGNTANHLRDRE